MLDSTQTMEVLETHKILFPSGVDRKDVRGGWIDGTQYVWFTDGANIDLYSTETRSVEFSRSFNDVETDKSLKITFVKEVQSEKIINLLLVGCLFKSSGILFVCELPRLTTICCITLPSPVSYISTILNKSLPNDELCNELKIMSTILLVGMATGEVYAIDLKEHYIKNQLKTNEIELKPGQLFIIKNNDDFQKAKQISNGSDCHLAMFLNETFYTDYKKQYCDKLDFSVSSLLYNENINAIVIGYSTGHLQLWDCKATKSYLLKEPKCIMPVTHITFLEPSDDPNNLCYLWIIQSDNSRLPNATMIALTYEQRTMMSNGCLSYKVFKENCIKLEMSLWKEAGIGRCISALSLCNDTLVRNGTDMNERSTIKLFAMLMEIRQNVNTSSESYIFLFDIHQWYKAQMPSNIDHFKISNSFASFVKLPHNTSYLDLNISDKTLRPFGYNFRNNVEELNYPSSIYFECDCLLDNEIIRYKHSGVQQEILDQLLLNKWKLFENPSSIFSQCLQTNLKPFFWDKTDDYVNYSLLDKVHFLIAVIVENEIMSVLNAYTEECKNEINVSCETIPLLMQCLWNHFTLVNKYTDQLCVSLFDYSGKLFCNKNENMLYKCLSQMLHIVHFYESMHSTTDSIQILNVDLMNREKKMKCVIQYFNSVIYFINYKLLPKPMEGDSMCQILQFNFSYLKQLSNKRRMEFGDLPLYLVDAFIANELKGCKLIEQWQQEFNNENKGLYPPSNIQDLLMINLNTELSHTVKNFIITYFLIDAYYLQEMNEIMTNVLNDISKKNDRLYKLCGATWFLDHDMFENAMLIFTNYNDWLIEDDSWNWYHWNVLKLLVFKEQYYWAQNYFDLFEIKLVNLDDHKFYINLQILSQNYFDAMDHMHSRGDMNEKNILFEYIFEKCRSINQLQKIFNYPFDEDEKNLFFSCLQKFDDTTSIQIKFLIQEKRYSEALEVYKFFGETKNVDITSILVGEITDIIPPINRRELNKKIYSDEEIKNLFMKDDIFNIKNTNVIGHNKSFQINMIKPDVMYNDEAIDKLRRPNIILDENIDKSNLVELDITLKSEDDLEKTGDSIFDKDIEYESENPGENYSVNIDTNIIKILEESIEEYENTDNECDLKEVHILCEEIVDNTFDGFSEENRSNDNYQEENENTFGNIINGNKTSFMVKENHVTKLLENKDNNSSAPNYSLGIENHKDDLYNNPNEFNHIPEYNLNYHNMIGDNEIQPISSLLGNFNLEAQAKNNGTQDSAIDNHEEIVTDEISEKNESSCVYKNVKDEKKSLHRVKIKRSELIQALTNENTYISSNKNSMKSNKDNVNLYDQEIEYRHIEEFTDDEIDAKILKFEKSIRATENNKLKKNYPSESSFVLPNKSKIIKEILYSDDNKNEPPIPLVSTTIITRSRSKQLKIESISSSTPSSTSKIIEDCFDNKSKKRSKCQNKNAKKKCSNKPQKSYSSTSSKHNKSIIIKEFVHSEDKKNEPPIPLIGTKMTTRSKQFKVESISSSTPSSTSKVIEDCFDNKSKKRTKCQDKNAKKKCSNKPQKSYSSASSKHNKSIIIKEFVHSDEKKNEPPIPLVSTKMTTRSKSKQVKVESISSSTPSSTSKVIEDCFDNKSKKRSKYQDKNAKKKCSNKPQKSYSSASSKHNKSNIFKNFSSINDGNNKIPIVILKKFDVEAYKQSFRIQKSNWRIIPPSVEENNDDTILKIRMGRCKNIN